jgi:phosphatidylserine/phosphatidylglycerophosphate/cardiolipin synthase-like enzyme
VRSCVGNTRSTAGTAAPPAPPTPHPTAEPIEDGDPDGAVVVSTTAAGRVEPPQQSEGIASQLREGESLVTVVCKPGFPEWEPAAVYFNPDITPRMVRALGQAKASIWFSQYCFDHNELVVAVTGSIRRVLPGQKIDVRGLLDKKQLFSPSCAKQTEALRTLIEWGAELRQRKPGTSFAAAQHEKTWVIDGALYICGSANATFNSLTNSEEAVVVSRIAPVVEQAVEHFERCWGLAQPVTLADLEGIQRARSNSSKELTRRGSDDEGPQATGDAVRRASVSRGRSFTSTASGV